MKWRDLGFFSLGGLAMIAWFFIEWFSRFDYSAFYSSIGEIALTVLCVGAIFALVAVITSGGEL